MQYLEQGLLNRKQASGHWPHTNTLPAHLLGGVVWLPWRPEDTTPTRPTKLKITYHMALSVQKFTTLRVKNYYQQTIPYY